MVIPTPGHTPGHQSILFRDGDRTLAFWGDLFPTPEHVHPPYVMAFDLETGDVIWTYRGKDFPYYSSPAVTEKHCLIGGRDKGLHCIDRVTGKAAWRFSARGNPS